MGFHHVPVLLSEVVEVLSPADGEVLVDCTLGGGGHTEALLSAANCSVIGLDRDPAALQAATERLAPYADRFTPVRSSFSRIGEVLDELDTPQVDGILADLGVSSHQLDTDERGFSFQREGPVDMRMDPDAPLSAADVVNEWSESDLADLIYQYGEDRNARRIARAIVRDRPFADTAQLADAIASVSRRKGRIHPATRSFQAIRIAVNDELGELERLLDQVVDRLLVGGRLAIISFHSLEDRLVKRFLSKESGKGLPRDPWGNPIGPIRLRPSRPVTPSPEDPNPRARSARLRSAVRIEWNER